MDGTGGQSPIVDPQLSLAAERTLLSWIRTGLAMMGFGFVVARFGLFLRETASQEHRLPTRATHISVWLGTALVMVGVIAFLVSARDQAVYLRSLSKGITVPVPKRSLGTFVAIALAALGLAMVAYLIIVALTEA